MTGGRLGIDPCIVLGSAVVGLLVGLTGAGGGALMTPMLILVFGVRPSAAISSDLVAAVLMRPAALGALAFGHVEFAVTTSIVIGSVPAVLIGSLLSARAPDRYIRPAITFVIFASGLKYVGVGTTALGWTLCAVLFVLAAVWLARARPWDGSRTAQPQAVPDASAGAERAGLRAPPD